MSLATRCTSCGIVFRVVQDQLKVSEGWVRCGRCDAVFNALEGLFDLERDQPPNWEPAAPPAPALASEAAGTAQAAASAHGADLPPPATVDERLFTPRAAPGPTAAERVRHDDRIDFEDARFNTELMGDDEPALAQGDAGAALAAMDPDSRDAVSTPAAPADDTPHFLRQAQRNARWDRPGMRRVLAATALLLLVALSLQALHQFRHVIAAKAPSVQPALAAWCAALGCTLDAPQRIQDLSVESTGLTQDAVGSNAYKLSVSLRNRGTLALAMPWIELSISDPNGQLVSRKALRPADFGWADATLVQPGADTPLQLSLAMAGPRVAGYTVELFYP